jgi:hypothetical protein
METKKDDVIGTMHVGINAAIVNQIQSGRETRLVINSNARAEFLALQQLMSQSSHFS